MFEGTYQNSIDAKNRMIVPLKFREELGDNCVLTKGIDKCLYIYATPAWEDFAGKLSALPTFDAKNRQLIRHFFSNACTCEFDNQGRIIIPQLLREYAAIEKDLLTMGFGNKIEIWSKTEMDNTKETDFGELAQDMAERGVNL